MAERRPLVLLDNNTVSELPAGDTLPGGGSQSALAAAIMALSPAIYYKCDEAPGATVLADSSGNGMDLTITGSPILGQAALVPGGGSFACPASSSSAHRAGRADTGGLATPMNYDWTLVAVVANVNVVSDEAYIVSISAVGETAATNQQLQAYLSVISTFWEYGSGSDISCRGIPAPAGRPFALCIRKSTATKTVDFFIDGMLYKRVNYTNEPTGGASTRLTVGAQGVGAGTGASLQSNVALFTFLLSDSEVATIASAAGFR